MANQEQLDILKQGVDVWNKWREENPYVEIHLEGANFAEADLNGANFSGADLRLINLGKTNLCQADLSAAILRGAMLQEANLDDTNLCRAILSKTDLNKASIKRADLRGADLSEAVLSETILFGSNLNWAYLNKTDLYAANLVGANLSGANLRHAKIFSANLTSVNLNDADLSASILSNSLLIETSLKGTNFSEAIWIGVKLCDADLSYAVGLETIKHYGRSTIGIDTLFKSKRNLNISFLRGAGVNETLINYIPTIAEKSSNYFSCFISYSHKDELFAQKLHDSLQDRGIRCWLDVPQMLPGDDFFDSVDKGIHSWDKFLLCCSKNSLISWWVDYEIEKAFKKEQQLMKERGKKVYALIPLTLDDYLFSDEFDRGFKSQIQSRLAANFTGWESDNSIFEEQFEKVVKALRTNGREEPPESKL